MAWRSDQQTQDFFIQTVANYLGSVTSPPASNDKATHTPSTQSSVAERLSNLSAPQLSHLRVALGGVLRGQDSAWAQRILALWQDPDVSETVRDALMPALRWDQEAASAAILAAYAAQVPGPMSGFDTSAPYRAMIALNERRDPFAAQALRDILISELGAAAQAA